jgi:hypothetical protein
MDTNFLDMFIYNKREIMESNREWRFYSFANLAIMPLQKGLQTAHLVSEVFVKYMYSSSAQAPITFEWAQNHKTVIILNGGFHGDLISLYETLDPLAEELGLPVVKFHEDEQTMNKMCTTVGIIVPSDIYNLEITFDPQTQDIWAEDFTPQQQLKAIISKYKLAV